jgi:hypothetical protein
MTKPPILVFSALFLGFIFLMIYALKLQEPEISSISGLFAGALFMGVVCLRWGLE